MLAILWADMDQGGFSAALAQDVLHFNGKLFKGAGADGYSLLLTPAQIDLLIAGRARATGARWSRHLRHPAGTRPRPAPSATPWARTTRPAPMSSAWCCPPSSSRCAPNGPTPEPPPWCWRTKPPRCKAKPPRPSWQKPRRGREIPPPPVHRPRTRPGLRQRQFSVCHAGALEAPGGRSGRPARSLGPHAETNSALKAKPSTLQQLRGIELNQRAAAPRPELVLWIGYLQWHIRTRGHAAVADARGARLRQHRMPRRRAGLDARELAYDDAGQLPQPLGWPRLQDPPRHRRASARRSRPGAQQWRYVGARQAACAAGRISLWATRRLLETSGCATPWAMATSQALRSAWPEVPESADFVMYWWHHAAAASGGRPTCGAWA